MSSHDDETRRVALVTGASGFTGSALVTRLLSRGWRVHALDLREGAAREGVTWFGVDLGGDARLEPAMVGVSVVFHLGALIAIPYSYQAPRSYVRANIEGTLNVLQSAMDEGVQRVLHTSTSEVYGTALFVPITEEHPLQGQSPYSASKIGDNT